MEKTLQILRHEIMALVTRPSFWLGVLGMPLLGFLLYAGVGLVNRSQGQASDSPSPINPGALFSQPVDTRPQGFVDPGRLVHVFPAGFPRQDFILFPDEASARQDLASGKISTYYVIPEDYLSTGQLVVYATEFNLLAQGERSGDLHRLLDYNLLGGDAELAQAIRNPLTNIERVNLAPPASGRPERDPTSPWMFFLPYGIMMLFFISIMGSSTMLLNSLTKEKENRVMEILLMTASPRQFLLGKIAGLGLVGLFQVVIWAASALTLLRVSGETFNLPPGFNIEPAVMLWGVLFFVLGYLVYSALMAGVGALVPSIREASQATTLITMPMVAPLFILSVLLDAPNGPLAVALSLFPFTAPTTMMLRLSAADVPLWQVLASVALLVVTDFIVIRAVAGLFRAQLIVSGQPFKVKYFFKLLFQQTLKP